MSKASAKRIKAFVDSFIQSEFVQNFTAERDSDFISHADRAARCYAAAELGCDGKTPSEVIADWRDAFSAWIDSRRCWNEPERFIAAVNAHFDAVESWHENNGSLWQQLG